MFPPCYLPGNQTMVEVMKIMATSFKRSHAGTAAPNPEAGHRQPMPLTETPGHSWASLGQYLVGSLLLFLGPGVHKALFVPSKSLFCQSCVSSGGSGVNGDLLQEGLSHTQVCCTQSPCLCSSPLMTRVSTGDASNTVLLYKYYFLS